MCRPSRCPSSTLRQQRGGFAHPMWPDRTARPSGSANNEASRLTRRGGELCDRVVRADKFTLMWRRCRSSGCMCVPHMPMRAWPVRVRRARAVRVWMAITHVLVPLMLLPSAVRFRARDPAAPRRRRRFGAPPPTLAIRARRAHCGGVKGDRVEIVIDAGTESRTYEVTATRAGRRVEIATRRGLVEVSEVTRSGAPVRTARFMSSRVIALVEHPATRSRAADDQRAPVRTAKPA
jgi:hypothetical protein